MVHLQPITSHILEYAPNVHWNKVANFSVHRSDTKLAHRFGDLSSYHKALIPCKKDRHQHRGEPEAETETDLESGNSSDMRSHTVLKTDSQ
jgi:putative ribosome biogenesis GTPase RsgA